MKEWNLKWCLYWTDIQWIPLNESLCHITCVLPFKHRPLRCGYNADPISQTNMCMKIRIVWSITQIPCGMCGNIVLVTGGVLHKTRTFPSDHQECYKPQWSLQIFAEFSSNVLRKVIAFQTKGKSLSAKNNTLYLTRTYAHHFYNFQITQKNKLALKKKKKSKNLYLFPPEYSL